MAIQRCHDLGTGGTRAWRSSAVPNFVMRQALVPRRHQTGQSRRCASQHRAPTCRVVEKFIARGGGSADATSSVRSDDGRETHGARTHLFVMSDTEHAVIVAPEKPFPLPAGASVDICTADIAEFLHVPVLSCVVERKENSWSAAVHLDNILDVERAIKANGKLLYGARMNVQALDSATAKRDKSRDARGQAYRNLYVLNLPLDISTEQLTDTFSTYGRVTHCVILAMLDAQARRRGFVDMEDADAAARAVHALHGYTWHGYPIDVSYALVQRGNGPTATDEHVVDTTAVELVGVNPVALIDEDDVRALVQPHVNPVRIIYPTIRTAGAPITIRIELETPDDARTVHTALASHAINGELLTVRRTA